MESDAGHVPVLLAETLELLAVTPGGLWVDGTLGLGGHAEAVLRASSPDGRLVGLDRDAEALEHARERLRPFGDRARLEHADYREIPERLGGEPASGILLDLGVSSLQLDDAERGFSLRRDGPLDMRMDRSVRGTAFELVNRLRESELADLIHELGEEPFSRRIARAIAPRARARADPDHRPSSPRSCAARRRAAAGPASIPRRARSRRCGSASTASSTGSATRSSARPPACVPAGAWS